jgi:hypothetical protein
MSGKSELKSVKKINLVDAIIAVVFMLALVAAIYLTVTIAFSDDIPGNEVQKQVEYRLCIENVDIERFGISLDDQTGAAKCDFLQIGDVLYSEDGSEQIGKISSIQYENATGSTGVTDSEGNLIYAEYPGRVNLILIVRGELDSDTTDAVRVGGLLSFHTPDYTANAKVLAVDTEVK